MLDGSVSFECADGWRLCLCERCIKMVMVARYDGRVNSLLPADGLYRESEGDCNGKGD